MLIFRKKNHNFVSPICKLNNPYCHNIYVGLLLSYLINLALLYFIKYSFAMVCKPNFAFNPADGTTTVWIFGERMTIRCSSKKMGGIVAIFFWCNTHYQRILKWFWVDFTILLSTDFHASELTKLRKVYMKHTSIQSSGCEFDSDLDSIFFL